PLLKLRVRGNFFEADKILLVFWPETTFSLKLQVRHVRCRTRPKRWQTCNFRTLNLAIPVRSGAWTGALRVSLKREAGAKYSQIMSCPFRNPKRKRSASLRNSTTTRPTPRHGTESVANLRLAFGSSLIFGQIFGSRL